MRAVNLIPADERGGSGIAVGRSGGSVYAVFGLIAGLAVLALLYGVSAHQVSSRQAEVAALNAKTQQAQARAVALAPYTSFAAMREQRVQAVDTLVNSRFDWAHAFHELGRVLPSNVSLTSLTGTVGSASGSSSSSSAKTSPSSSSSSSSSSSVASATPPGSVPTFTIAGCTTSQAQVALVLDRLRLIDGVSEVSLQSSTKSGSSGGSSSAGAGGCGSSDAVFNMTVTFDALPSITASGSSSTTVAASTSGAASPIGAAR
jgi:Tfp pilus assembly protein PilN